MQFGNQLSLSDLSPLANIPKDHLLVAFKAYFDGGNEVDGSQFEVVTLAAISGDSIHWANFESQWWDIVRNRHHAKWLHTTDAVGLTGPFSIRNGWTTTKINALISDCVSVLERCCSAQDKNDFVIYEGLRPSTISVNLPDFKRALVKIPKLGTVEHLCATNCVQNVFSYGIYIAHAARFQLFFDQGEPFYGHIRDRVDNRASRKHGPLWKMVTHLGESDMREVPALQAADLFAWSVNHFIEEHGARFDWQKRLLRIKRENTYFRYARMMKPIWEHVELLQTFNLPKRKPSRL